MMSHYVALIHKEPDNDFGVMFPDFPGCASAGGTVDDAMKSAADALSAHAEVMRSYGETIPTP